MKAKEMFEQLGFNVPKETWHCIEYDNIVEDCHATFYKYEKSVCVYDSEYNDAMNISMPLFGAIQKQLEELGWLSEQILSNPE